MVAPPDTDERNRSLEERVSRLEGGYAHLATKADIERVLVAVERNRADIIKLVVQVAGLGVALLAAGIAFLRLTGTG